MREVEEKEKERYLSRVPSLYEQGERLCVALRSTIMTVEELQRGTLAFAHHFGFNKEDLKERKVGK